jgi:hypothetical protein
VKAPAGNGLQSRIREPRPTSVTDLAPWERLGSRAFLFGQQGTGKGACRLSGGQIRSQEASEVRRCRRTYSLCP